MALRRIGRPTCELCPMSHFHASRHRTRFVIAYTSKQPLIATGTASRVNSSRALGLDDVGPAADQQLLADAALESVCPHFFSTHLWLYCSEYCLCLGSFNDRLQDEIDLPRQRATSVTSEKGQVAPLRTTTCCRTSITVGDFRRSKQAADY